MKLVNIENINNVIADEQSTAMIEIKEHAKANDMSVELVVSAIRNAVSLASPKVPRGAKESPMQALQKCSVQSFLRVVRDSVTIGLLPNTGNSHCFIVPYNGEATFQMGYQGYLELAGRAGVHITSGSIHQNDNVTYRPTDIYNPLEIESRIVMRGKAIAYYAIATKGNQRFAEVMEINEIDKIKTKAKMKAIWDYNYSEMARKTVVRRLCKQIRHVFQNTIVLNALNNADEYDNQGFRDDVQKAYIKETPPEPTETKAKAKTTAPKKAEPPTPTRDYAELGRIMEQAGIDTNAQLQKIGKTELSQLDDATFDKWLERAKMRAAETTPPTAPIIDVIPENPQTPEQQAIKDTADMYAPETDDAMEYQKWYQMACDIVSMLDMDLLQWLQTNKHGIAPDILSNADSVMMRKIAEAIEKDIKERNND